MSLAVVPSPLGYPVTIVESGGLPVTMVGGGGDLLPTQAIIDDGQQITATNGQTILVAVADNVPSLTVKNWAFWEPFTVTVGEVDGPLTLGYATSDWTEGEQAGAITNEPVSGFALQAVSRTNDGWVEIFISGPHPIAGELQGALIGIDGVDYLPNGLSSSLEDGAWGTQMIAQGVPAWTVDQQVPIVIIPVL